LVVAEWGWPPDTSTATVALGTTAPEGSVTWPRKVPVVVDDCAHAGAESPISVAGIRIAKTRIAEIRFAEMKTDKYFNTHPIPSGQSNFIENNGLRLIRYCVASPSPPDAPSDHGESRVDAL
jgi:hypothetical protein